MRRVLLIIAGGVLCTIIWCLCAILPFLSRPVSIPTILPSSPTVPLAQWVDPMIGAGGHPLRASMLSPAAATPWGLVQVGPDTAEWNHDWLGLMPFLQFANSGFNASHQRLLGFSHTRLSGAGLPSGGILRILPVRDGNIEDKAEFAIGDHKARAGWYEADLKDRGVAVRLAASSFVGHHQYRYTGSGEHSLYIDFSSVIGIKDHSWTIADVTWSLAGRVLQGSVTTFTGMDERAGPQTLFFAIAMHPWPVSMQFYRDGDSIDGTIFAKERALSALIRFADADSDVHVAVGLSVASKDEAQIRADSEANFDVAKQYAQSSWDQILGSVDANFADPVHKRIFYTALYRTALQPAERDAKDYSELSMWDTYRLLHPWYSVVWPRKEEAIVASLTQRLKAQGEMPQWPHGAGDSKLMTGAPAAIVVADSRMRGVPVQDLDAWIAALRKASAKAVFSADRNPWSVSQTIDWSAAFKAGAVMAKYAAPEAVADFQQRSQEYRKLWDARSLRFAPKDAAGNFVQSRLPWQFAFLGITDFAEGSPEQWRWAEPALAEEALTLWPSNQAALSSLSRFFEDRAAPDAILPTSQYWHGNEPDMHAVLVAHFLGDTKLANAWMQDVLNRYYAATTAGWPGQDDGGALSAFYVWGSLGLMPVPLSERYWIFTPSVTTAKIHLGTGAVLSIIRSGDGTQATFNGVPLKHPWITHNELMHGGTLQFQTPSNLP